MKRNTYFMDEEVKTDKVDVKYLGRILKRIAPYKKLFLTALFLLIFSSVLSLLPPAIIRAIINEVIPMEEERTRTFLLYMAGLAGIGLLTALLPYFYRSIMGTVGHGIITDLRREIFSHLQELPFEYYDTRPAGKISIRVTEYINELADFFTSYLLDAIVSVLKIIVGTVLMLCISPLLTAVVYAALIPLTVCVLLVKSAVRKLFRTHRAKNSNRNAFIVESIMGEKVIKNYNRSDYNQKVYYDLQEDSFRTWMKIVRRNELNAPVSEFFWNAGTLALYAVAFALMSAGDASIAGTVIAFLLYMGLCSEPLLQITASCSSSRRSRRISNASTRPSIPPSPLRTNRAPPSCTTSREGWTSTTSPSATSRASPSSNISISTSAPAKRSPSSAPRARARRRSSTF